MKPETRARIHAYVDAHRQEIIETLQGLIRIPSVKAAPVPGAPFGQDCADALAFVLDKASNMGFSTQNHDNYIGYCEAGEADTCFGVLTHLDVVPVSDGWDQPPFSGAIVGNEMYGRGTMDNKGPAIASLFALAAVRETGLPLRKRARLIFGCDEESGWDDIAYYKTKEDLPELAISPDAEYPVINAEKGIAQVQISAQFPADAAAARVVKLTGGTRANVVPAEAFATLEGVPFATVQSAANAVAAKYHISIETADTPEGVTLHAVGLAAHAMDPSLGKNAIEALLEVFAALPLSPSEPNAALARLHAAFPFDDYNGNAAGIACHDQISGPLTANFGLIDFTPTALNATIDIRHPVSSNADMLLRLLGDQVKLDVSFFRTQGPHFVSPQSELVQTLLRVYENETGLPGKCLSIGGGTYARAIENAVTFGCQFPGAPDLAHQANERIDLDDLILNTKILACAIAEICQ